MASSSSPTTHLLGRLSKVLVVLAAASLLIGVAAACGDDSDSDGDQGADLTGTVWQWTTGTDAQGAGAAVPDPESYTIEFSGDDTYQGQADCNSIAGAYTIDDEGSMNIEPGPSTLVACPEGSLGDVFVGILPNVESYSIDTNTLTLTLNNGGVMEFMAAA